MNDITSAIQLLGNRSGVSACICGEWLKPHDMSEHRRTCLLLRTALIGDIVRVAVLLDKTPTLRQYENNSSPLLPSWNALYAAGVFSSWNEALMAARLKPRKHTINSKTISEQVVNILQQMGGLTITDLCQEIYGEKTSTAVRSMYFHISEAKKIAKIETQNIKHRGPNEPAVIYSLAQ